MQDPPRDLRPSVLPPTPCPVYEGQGAMVYCTMYRAYCAARCRVWGCWRDGEGGSCATGSSRLSYTKDQTRTMGRYEGPFTADKSSRDGIIRTTVLHHDSPVRTVGTLLCLRACYSASTLRRTVAVDGWSAIYLRSGCLGLCPEYTPTYLGSLRGLDLKKKKLHKIQ